jgi:hypothetical protein
MKDKLLGFILKIWLLFPVYAESIETMKAKAEYYDAVLGEKATYYIWLKR